MNTSNNTPPEPSTPPPPPPASPPAQEPDATPQPSFTKEDVDKMTAGARNAATSQAQRQLLEQLGFGSADEAAEFIRAKKEEDDAKLSEADRKIKEAEEREARAAAREAAAVEREARADLRSALLASGVRSDRVEMAETLAAGSVVAAEDPSEVIAAEVERLKASTPEWFAEPSNGDQTTPPPPGSSTPPPPNRDQTPPPNNGPKPLERGTEKGKAWLERRRPKAKA